MSSEPISPLHLHVLTLRGEEKKLREELDTTDGEPSVVARLSSVKKQLQETETQLNDPTPSV